MGAQTILFVNSAADYHLPRTGLAWGADGLPAQPYDEWRFADGADWDTTSAGFYRNHGSGEYTAQDRNQPALSEGILSSGQAGCEFDGVNDVVDVNDGYLGAGNLSGGFTIAAWVRPTSYSAGLHETGRRIADKSTATYGQGGFYWSVWRDDSLTAFAVNGGVTRKSAAKPPLNEWSLVAVTVSSSAVVTHYINGAASGTPGATGALSGITTASKLSLGNRSGNTDMPFKGDIDWLAMWTSELSAAQVAALFAATAPEGEAGAPFPSLQSAVWSANNRGLVEARLAGGVYRESVTLSIDSLSLVAADLAQGPRPAFTGDLLPGSPIGIIAGVSTTMEGLSFRGYNQAVRLTPSSGQRFGLIRLEIAACATGINLAGTGGAMDVVLQNCSINGAQVGVSSTSGVDSLSAVNCLFTGCGTAGLLRTSGAVLHRYCNFYDNAAHTSGAVQDAGGSRYFKPLFRSGDDLRPRPWSQVLRFGDPQVSVPMGAWTLPYRPLPAAQSAASSGWSRRLR